jgi:hypothetical protein
MACRRRRPMSSASRERNPAHSVGVWLAGANLKPVKSVRSEFWSTFCTANAADYLSIRTEKIRISPHCSP